MMTLAAGHIHDNENEPDRISVSDETSYIDWLLFFNGNRYTDDLLGQVFNCVISPLIYYYYYYILSSTSVNHVVRFTFNRSDEQNLDY